MIILNIKRIGNDGVVFAQSLKIRYRRMLLPAFLVVLCFQPNTQEIVLSVLSDAFLQVSAFVAATLAVYYLITHYVEKRIPVHVITNNIGFELIGSAFLGALPGCGGAIVVITQFTRGNLRFGSVVAVLTSTMGDAAFLLLAQKPFDGLVVMALGFSVGVVSGGITNFIHQENFMRPATKINTSTSNKVRSMPSKLQTQASLVSYQFWRVALFPTLIVALLISFQVDPNSLFGFELGTVEKAGAIACFFIVFLWSISSIGSSYQEVTSEENLNVKSNWVMKAALDTQFVTSWVVAAFLSFELVITWTGFDLAANFQSLGPLAILLAIAVGLLPGCGPQILITTLYLQNTIPFSAQIGNAISNDGDALFPAIALAPKAAIVATFYSTIPALVAGYGYYLFFE